MPGLALAQHTHGTDVADNGQLNRDGGDVAIPKVPKVAGKRFLALGVLGVAPGGRQQLWYGPIAAGLDENQYARSLCGRA